MWGVLGREYGREEKGDGMESEGRTTLDKILDPPDYCIISRFFSAKSRGTKNWRLARSIQPIIVAIAYQSSLLNLD
jgi:hypothetical protein